MTLDEENGSRSVSSDQHITKRGRLGEQDEIFEERALQVGRTSNDAQALHFDHYSVAMSRFSITPRIFHRVWTRS